MKKTLLALSLTMALATVSAQNLMTENFDSEFPTNWVKMNNSTYPSLGDWGKQNMGEFSAHSGAADSYLETDYTCAALNATISNWLFTPSLNLQNGDVISFYSRTRVNPNQYPDRLELRIGQGNSIADPAGEEGVGGYTTLALTINPDLTTTGYPAVWTKYSYTVTGMATVTPCKIAFRYYVTNGGTSGDNSDLIGIDTFSVDRNLGTEEFFADNFSIYPNPVKDVFYLTAKNQTAIQNVKVIDMNGRTVNEMNTSDVSELQLNIADLNAGVYFVKVQSESGVGTTKIVKR